MQNELFQQAKQAAQELVAAANLKKGDILVVGCSSSEVAGGVIGHNSSLETACRCAERRGGLRGAAAQGRRLLCHHRLPHL